MQKQKCHVKLIFSSTFYYNNSIYNAFAEGCRVLISPIILDCMHIDVRSLEAMCEDIVSAIVIVVLKRCDLLM